MNQEIQSAFLALDKSERKQVIETIITAINNEEVNIIDIHQKIKITEELIKAITSDKSYKESLLNEVSKFGKTHDVNFGKMQIKEAGTKYDYSVCNDSEIDDLLNQKSFLDEKIKDRQKFLQTLPSEGLTSINEETGEAVTLYPPAKSSETIVSLTLK